MHFTPTYSSWINQVERFFAYVTTDLLQRSDHRNVQTLEADIRKWIKAWNENPQPFIGSSQFRVRSGAEPGCRSGVDTGRCS